MISDDQPTTEQIERHDQNILSDVEAVLRGAGGFRSVEPQDLSVSAEAGMISLRGHVESHAIKGEAERLSAAVAGVEGVHNALVVDPDLAAAVARALAADVSTRSSVFRVGASAGWIQLGGEAPDAQVRDEAQAVAASVPAVRGILSLPRLPGQTLSKGNRPLQPKIGTTVYAADGELGEVVGVVIDPQDRLVTHVIVGARPLSDRPDGTGGPRLAIPVEAITMITVGGTMLTDTRAAAGARPRYHAADYPWPPADWQLPFPYHAGEVQWPAHPAKDVSLSASYWNPL